MELEPGAEKVKIVILSYTRSWFGIIVIITIIIIIILPKDNLQTKEKQHSLLGFLRKYATWACFAKSVRPGSSHTAYTTVLVVGAEDAVCSHLTFLNMVNTVDICYPGCRTSLNTHPLSKEVPILWGLVQGRGYCRNQIVTSLAPRVQACDSIPTN